MKTLYRDLTGIVLLDKPQGLSSNQALQKVRHLYQAKKAGHTGSLDPLATGLLPICLGEATKIAGFLLGSAKAYQVCCLLGQTTTTDDAEGEFLHKRVVPPLDDETIEAALIPLRGKITQTAPVYSALKQAGVPLYKRARRGEDVQAPQRQVEVTRFTLSKLSADALELEVECGSGTYVRSLVRDLGEALGCGAHVTALRRTWVAPFFTPQMVTLETLAARAECGGCQALDELLLPLDQGLCAMPAVQLDHAQSLALRQGKKVADLPCTSATMARAIDPDGALIALVEIGADGLLCVRRGFNSR